MEKKAIKAILIKEKKLWVQILVCRFFTKAHLVAGSDTDSTKVPWVGKRMRGFEPSVYNTAGCLWIQGMARLWITMLCRFLSTYSATYFPSLNFTSGKAQRCFRDSWLFFFPVGSWLRRAGSLVAAHGFSLRLTGLGVYGLQWSQCSGLVALGTWNLSSPTRDRTHIPCIARRIL